MIALEEDRLILHDLRGANVKVDFFFGSREEIFQQTECLAYSLYWESVDIRVDQITATERLYNLDFFFNTQRLYIDDQIITGEVFSFRCDIIDGILTAFCKIALGKDY